MNVQSPDNGRFEFEPGDDSLSRSECSTLLHVYVDVVGPLTWSPPGTPGLPDLPPLPPPTSRSSAGSTPLA